MENDSIFNESVKYGRTLDYINLNCKDEEKIPEFLDLTVKDIDGDGYIEHAVVFHKDGSQIHSLQFLNHNKIWNGTYIFSKGERQWLPSVICS